MRNKRLDQILVASEIAATVATVYFLIRIMAGPDGFRTVKMRMCRSVSRTAKQQSDGWTEISTRADTAYWKLSNITA